MPGISLEEAEAPKLSLFALADGSRLIVDMQLPILPAAFPTLKPLVLGLNVCDVVVILIPTRPACGRRRTCAQEGWYLISEALRSTFRCKRRGNGCGHVFP